MLGPIVAVAAIRAPGLRRIHPHPLTGLNDKVRVLVVDDHPLLREGIAAVLTGKSDLTIVGQASDATEAVEQFRVLQPDVTVMDLQMPGMSGIDAMRTIRHEAPTARVVMLTSSAGHFLALRALKAGACAYVSKECVGIIQL